MPERVASIRDLIDRMAATQGDDVFLRSPEASRAMTFSDLQLEARNIASRLLELGLSKGDKVALLLENGLTAAKLELGAMYGGFVPAPLNVGAGPAQLEYVLRHSDAGVVFFSEEYADLVHNATTKVGREIRKIITDRGAGPEWGEANSEIEPVFPELDGDDEALLMYTSGSTSEARGAILCHKNLLASGTNTVEAHQLCSKDKLLCVLPLYHMNAQATLISTLLSGGCVLLPRRFNVNSFWDWVATYGCTWSSLVPTIIAHLLNWTDPHADGRGAGLKQVRFMRSSSAPLSPEQHRAFEKKFKLVLIEAMGSTEAGGKFFFSPLPPRERKVGSPGIPHGFQARVLNADQRDLPEGQKGEIVIGGPSVMKGYYKNPQETAEVLTPEGWLRTGDLGYRDNDGYFFIVGRVKELIIKGGENIAPREIDEALERHPAVLEAATVGVPDPYLGEDIVACVVLRPNERCDKKEILLFCEQEVGPLKTPTHIHFVDELPKGPSGKTQRLKLVDWLKKSHTTELEVQPSESFPKTTKPTAEIETCEQIPDIVLSALAEIWAEVLGRDKVDDDENFFELGGDSLLAANILSQVRDEFQVELPMRSLFENPTVAGLAAQIRQTQSGGAGAATEKLANLESPTDGEATHEIKKREK